MLAALCVAIFTVRMPWRSPATAYDSGSKLVPSVDVYSKYETNPGRLAENEGPKVTHRWSRESASIFVKRAQTSDSMLQQSRLRLFLRPQRRSNEAVQRIQRRFALNVKRISGANFQLTLRPQSYGQPTLKSAHSTRNLSIHSSGSG